MNINETLEMLKNDKAFLEELGKAESVGDVQKLFADKGIEVSKEELNGLINNGEEKELDAKALDQVSGGYGGILVGVAAILFLAGLSKGMKC